MLWRLGPYIQGFEVRRDRRYSTLSDREHYTATQGLQGTYFAVRTVSPLSPTAAIDLLGVTSSIRECFYIRV